MANATEVADLPRYGDWAPTGFDVKGLGCPDQQDWLVCPVTYHRDSAGTLDGELDISNFESFKAALEEVDPDEEDFEVHNFGHWGHGWFTIILVRPDTKAWETACELTCALADYPILDEMAHSEREYEVMHEAWEWMGLRDRIRLCVERGVSKFAARRVDTIPSEIYAEHLLGC